MTNFDVIRRARKQHVCFHCGNTIEPGEQCWYRSGVASDGWWQLRLHLDCKPATESYTDGDWEFGYPYPPLDRQDVSVYQTGSLLSRNL